MLGPTDLRTTHHHHVPSLSPVRGVISNSFPALRSIDVSRGVRHHRHHHRHHCLQDEDRKEKSERLLNYFIGYAVPTAPGKCRIFTRWASRGKRKTHTLLLWFVLVSSVSSFCSSSLHFCSFVLWPPQKAPQRYTVYFEVYHYLRFLSW